MKHIWIFIILLTLTACGAPAASPSPTSTATVAPSPTSTISPTKTPSPTATATLLYEPLEGPHYREIARYDMKEGIGQSVLSPDGSMLAVLTRDGVYLYDPDTLELRWLEQGGVRRPGGFTWTPDNKLVLCYGGMPDHLIDPEDRSILEEINIEIPGCGYNPSPGGKYYTTYNPNDRFSIYDTITRELLLSLTDSYTNRSLVWTPDGDHVIFFPDEGSIEIWNIERGEIIQELENQFMHYEVWAAGFSPDERYFAYYASMYDQQHDIHIDRKIVWDLSTGEQLPVEELDGSPSNHGWQLDEQTFVLNEGLVVRINGSVAEMTWLHESTRFSGRLFRRPDGLLVIFGDAVVRYDNDFNLTNSTTGHSGEGAGVTNKALSPDGQMLAIGAATRFYIWDIGQNELLTIFVELGGYESAIVVWSPDSNMLALANLANRQISIWNKNSPGAQKTFDAGSLICDIEWVDDSTLALALTKEPDPIFDGGCMTQFLAIFDIKTGQIVYREEQSAYYSGFFSLFDQRHIASYQWSDVDAYASYQWSDVYTDDVVPTLVIWDIQTRQRSHEIKIDPSGRLFPLQNPLGVVIATEGLCRVINLETGEESIINLNTDKSGYVLGDYILVYDFKHFELSWYDLDGNHIETGGFEFWPYVAGDPIITADGRILDLVNPGDQWGSDVALLELFPPEQ